MNLRARVAAWLDGRSSRERTLLGMAGALVAASLALAGGAAIRDDLHATEARVAAHERELAQVRRLATALERARAETPAATATDGAPSLPTLLEAAAGEVVGRERIASMTPAAADDGETRIALRIAGASLDETVRLVHALESAAGPVLVARLAIEKHTDDAHRFDVVVEVRAATAAEAAP